MSSRNRTDLLNIIHSRRSIRRFLKRPVSDTLIRKLIEAAIWAPTTCNQQLWNFTVVKDKKTNWDGVRNYQARNNLRAMKKGDQLLFYHSVGPKTVVGVAQISREHFPDPTATSGDWSAVEVKPVNGVWKLNGLDIIGETRL